MALQKQIVPVLIDGGIDTKTQEKLVSPGSMLSSQNTDFSSFGAIKKTNGLTQLTNTTNDGRDLSAIAEKIFSHNDELVAIGRGGSEVCYSYDSEEDRFIAKGGIVGVDSVTDRETSDAFTSSVSSVECVTKGFKVTAINQLNNKPETDPNFRDLRLRKVDYSTGQERTVDVTTSGFPANARQFSLDIVDAATPYIILVFTENSRFSGTTISGWCRVYDEDLNELHSLQLFSYDTTIYPMYNPSFDTVFIGNDSLVVVANGDGSDNIELINVNYVAGTSAIIYTYSDPGSQVQSINSLTPYYNTANVACCLSGDNVYVAYVTRDDASPSGPQASRNVKLFAVERTNLANVVKGPIVVSPFTNQWYKLTISETTTNDVVWVAASYTNYELNVTPPDLGDTFIWKVDCTTGTPTLPVQQQVGRCYLSSKLFRIDPSSDDFSVVLCATNQDDSQLCLVNFTENDVLFPANQLLRTVTATFGTIDVQFIPRVDNNEDLYPVILNKISLGKDGKYYFPFLDLKEEGKSLSTQIFDFNSADFVTTRLSESTHISGGLIKEYNGERLLSSGFVQSPLITNITTGGAGSVFPAGTYSFSAIYKYYDNNGEVHRSRPTPIQTFDLGVAVDVFSITVSTPNFNVDSEKEAQSEIEIYMSEANGINLFYNNSLFANNANNTQTLNIGGMNTDSKFLYTTGGVLDNDPVPSMSYIASGLERIFGVSAEDGNKIYYSQKRIVENSVDWSDFLFFRVDGYGKRRGRAVAIENLDDKMVILKEDSVSFISGDGPLPTGQRNTFTSPTVMSHEVGCTEKQSVAATPVGVMFKGKKGIYLAGRDLTVNYVGSGVEQFNSEEIKGTEVHTERNEVYFQTANRALVYNYLQNKWSTNESLGGKSICLWKDQVTVLKADGRIYAQTLGEYKDNGAALPMRVITPWYKTSGFSSFGRIYEIMILGNYKTDHTLKVRVYYDYDDSDFTDYQFSVTSTNKYEFRVKPSKQKCESFKIEIYDEPDLTTTGESFELTSLSLRVGVKNGHNKLSDSRKR